MPGLLIPLVNEAFGTSFSNKEKVVLLQNNYYERYGKIIADSLIKISDRTFHIEMQSTDCGKMVIRMFEYDYTFAVNNAVIKDGSYEINMPEYEAIINRVLKIADNNEDDSYIDLVDLMDKILGYLARSEQSKERMGMSMKARVLELWSERERRLGKHEGISEGRAEGKVEGKAEDREEINELNRCLLRDNRLDDLERSTTDIEFQNSLLAEYGIGSYKAECAEG